MAVKITTFAHGTTLDNEQDISSGWSDVELSELGKNQAISLKEQIKDRVFDVVFTSDMKRAIDTANLAFDESIKKISDTRLRECNYGTLNSGPCSVVEPMCDGECIYNKFPEGESYEDVKLRIAGFLQYLKDHYDGKSVAVVSHKAPQLALEVLINKKTWDQALAEDWRKTKSWQPGWDYKLI